MKPVLKISPTTLENYRTCYMGRYGKTVEDFIRNLDEPWVRSEAQSKGEAYHKLLEHGPDPYRELCADGVRYRVNDPQMNIDWMFSEQQAAPALRTWSDHPDLQREQWARLIIDLDDYYVQMNMRTDAMSESVIWDYKTTGSKYAPKKETYYESVQWPLYMMRYDLATCFRYRVFHLHDGTCDQYDYIFDKSPEREEYARRWLTHLVDFARRRGIIEKFILPQPTRNDTVPN